MKNKFFFFTLLSFMLSIMPVLSGNLQRLASFYLPGQEKNVHFEQLPSADTDFFELETQNGKLIIRGNNGVSMARGLNYYLRYYLHQSTSWCGSNLKKKNALLPVNQKIRVEASFPLRYYLNYCTYSYSMAFWDWKRWEKEIDWMAMQGINMPLVAVLGQHAVWQNTLRKLGYTEDDILAFLPGPGYEAWWLMGNLEKFGGPVSQTFIDRQAELQKKIVNRMREYGMEPVFQGFYGMVPHSTVKKYPTSDVRSVGEWIVYQRPAFINPTDSLFDRIANVYYEEQTKLFGKARYFGGDPFHEGGSTEGIDITKAASGIYRAMARNQSNAVWVLQGWGGNPTYSLLKGLKKEETLILDLMACGRPGWGGVPTSVNHRPEGFLNYNWLWCALPNFGGRIGLYGKLDRYANGAYEAAHHPKGTQIQGIGVAPEGIGANVIDYDLVYDRAWTDSVINVDSWVNSFTVYRYGQAIPEMEKAWSSLAATVYNCPTHHDGPQESFFCARPGLKIDKVSTWGTAELYYQPIVILESLEKFLQAGKQLKKIDTYRFDLVDLTRQLLADYGKLIHARLVQAYQTKNQSEFDAYSATFLELIADQDQLLSTRSEFLLGNWTRQAAAWGNSAEESERFVRNAKRQVTTWTDVDSSLHEYSNREWAGLLSTLYLHRWKSYFSFLKQEMNGESPAPLNFYAMDEAWVNSSETGGSNPKGDEWKEANRIYGKYASEIKYAYKQQ